MSRCLFIVLGTIELNEIKYARKIIYHVFLVWTGKSIPRAYCSTGGTALIGVHPHQEHTKDTYISTLPFSSEILNTTHKAQSVFSLKYTQNSAYFLANSFVLHYKYDIPYTNMYVINTRCMDIYKITFDPNTFY